MKKQNRSVMIGHILGVFTAVIWGTTFISTKLLLGEMAPIEVLIYRFIAGYFVLVLVCPKPLKFTGLKEELWYLAAGLSGVTIYFLFENVALTYTLAGNVGVIVSTAPMFTAILAFLFLKEERPKKYFFLGFLVAMSGILLINYNGRVSMKLNPKGDFLALGAAFVWAVYSIIIKKHLNMGENMIAATRRIIFYGLISMIPFGFLMGFSFEPVKLMQPEVIGNLLFLSIGATSICYIIWNWTVQELGAVKASVYIYIVPAITIVASAVFLGEIPGIVTITGAFLTIIGLLLSEKKDSVAENKLLDK